MSKIGKISLFGLVGMACLVGCQKESGGQTASRAVASKDGGAFILMNDLNPEIRNDRAKQIALALSRKASASRAPENSENKSEPSKLSLNQEGDGSETSPSQSPSQAFKLEQCFNEDESTVALTDQSKTCPGKIKYKGEEIEVEMGEGEALPFPDRRVRYCQDGKLQEAREVRKMREMLIAAGATNEELGNVRFFYTPTKVYNAWATQIDDGTGIINLHEGLLSTPAEAPSVKAVSTDGELAGVLLHELGHILDLRREGFSNLQKADERVMKRCEDHLAGARSCSEFSARAMTCETWMGAKGQTYEYSADNNVAKTFSRVKDKLTMNPHGVVDVFKTWGQGFDPTGSHPPGADRAIYMSRALNEQGVAEKRELAGRSWIKAITGSE